MTDINTNIRVEPTSTAFHFYLTSVIDGPDKYTDLFHTLNMASPADTVYIHLNTPGGNFFTAANLVQCIKESEAMVVACADGEVASAGSIIFFSCPAMKIGDYCSFLIHDGSKGSIGKVNENLRSAKSDSEIIRKLYFDVYHPYLNKKEINEVLKGQDMYLSSDEVNKRVEKVIKMVEKQLEESEK